MEGVFDTLNAINGLFSHFAIQSAPKPKPGYPMTGDAFDKCVSHLRLSLYVVSLAFPLVPSFRLFFFLATTMGFPP